MTWLESLLSRAARAEAPLPDVIGVLVEAEVEPHELLAALVKVARSECLPIQPEPPRRLLMRIALDAYLRLPLTFGYTPLGRAIAEIGTRGARGAWLADPETVSETALLRTVLGMFKSVSEIRMADDATVTQHNRVIGLTVLDQLDLCLGQALVAADDLEARWEQGDPDCEDYDNSGDHDWWGCRIIDLSDERTTLASLWCIDRPDAAYRREIEEELLAEAGALLRAEHGQAWAIRRSGLPSDFYRAVVTWARDLGATP